MNRAIADGSGSSPHTRGAPPEGSRMLVRARIIPAYAGSTGPPVGESHENTDHPRIRGEHDSMTSSAIWAFGSSPHTRGARAPRYVGVPGVGIIPAYAGSTPWLCATRFAPGDHPRIRGEHRHNSWTNPLARGSSPHTRGALDTPAGRLFVAGIIPAYAGSTLL